MPASIKGKEILVKDEREGSQLYNKGYFGTPQPGGSLKLEIAEALYLLEAGRLEIRRNRNKVGKRELILLGERTHSNFEVSYLVYRDLRQRGYVVKPGVAPMDLRVFPRGGGPGSTPSEYWVCGISERSVFDIEGLLSRVKEANAVRKRLILAIVDEESDLTYYRARLLDPRGKVEPFKSKGEAEVLFLGDRAVVLNEDDAKMLHETQSFGKIVGSSLQLSLLETAFLLKRNAVEVRNSKTGRKIGLGRLIEEAAKVQPDFKLRLRVYENLKERGIIVKTGFKYGSHFRAYKGYPDKHHARYLVHSLPSGYKGMWPEISRAVRLAHGVKKEIVFGRVGEGIEYISLKRVKP